MFCAAGVSFSQEIDTFAVKAVVGVEFVLRNTAAFYVEGRYNAVVGGDADATLFIGGASTTESLDLGLSAPSAQAGFRFYF